MDNNKDKDFGLPKTKFEPVNINGNRNSINGRKGASTRVLVFSGLLFLIIGSIVGGIFLLKNREDDEVENKDSTSIFEDTEGAKTQNKEQDKQKEKISSESTTKNETANKYNDEVDESITDNSKAKKSSEDRTNTTNIEEQQNVTTIEEMPEGDEIKQNESTVKQDSESTIKNIDIRKNDIRKVYKPQNKYYIIWGAFLDEKNAYTRANKIKQGLQVTIIYPNGESIRHKVSIAEANHLEEANKIKNRLKKDYPGIWTFKY